MPLELDQIYSSLDRLTVALGPNGANANGALTDLLETTAANFGGQGAKFRQTLADFSTLSETLDDNKEELFGSLTELEGFVSTLADNDDTVRRFNQSLADVSTMLSGESDELSAALANLSTALGQVGTFVEENKASLGRNITGLNRVAKILVKRRSELDQILRIAPVALTNLALAYNPDTGTLDTNANLGNLVHELESDPGRLLCALVSANDDQGTICDLIEGLLPAPGRPSSRLRRLRQAEPEAGLPEQVRPLAERSGDGPMMRKKLAAGVALLISSVVLSGCDFDVYQLPLPGGTDVGDDPMSITVEFRDVLDLVPQSTVKVNDVNVGKVTDVELDGYTAKVTLELQKDTELPDNAIAEIRQTSLLGEKFVSLSPPTEGASDNPLGDGDIIPLERSGRNPEVEEVLGALSLVLNGGGVAQLKTIASELNLALEGREDSAKSVLTQIDSLMGQLDENRTDIVNAIDSLDRLASSAREQQDSIDAALVELPSALESIDGQREDLVKMLGALNRLGDVGVRVIKASKDSTIEAVPAAAAGAHRARQLRRRVHRLDQRVPDLPVRRRGRRSRPPGGSQPAHG